MEQPDPKEQDAGVERWLAASARARFRENVACFLLTASLAALAWAIPAIPVYVAVGFTGFAAGFFLGGLLNGSTLFEGLVFGVILSVVSVGLVYPIRIIMKHS